MRFYEIGGIYYPSATTVLEVIRNKGLETWRGVVGNHEFDARMKNAGDFGTYIHEQCRLSAIGWRTANPHPRVRAFENWFDKYVEHLVFAERAVWSEKYGYAGRSDLGVILRGDTEPALVDLKTGVASSTFPMQLSAYRQALEERGIQTRRRGVLRLDAAAEDAGMARWVEYPEEEHAADLRAFLYALGIFNYLRRGKIDEHADIVRISG